MRATIVVVDTNSIATSPRLRSAGWKGLIEKSSDWNVQFKVPAVVAMEAVTVVRRRWDDEKDAVEKLRVNEFGLGPTVETMLATIQAQQDGYENELYELLDKIGAELVPVPAIDHLEIARRASERRAPYFDGRQDKSRGTASTKDGYRDTVIWLTLLEIARANPDSDVWFVSTNHTDFGPRQEKKPAIPDDACPYPLHPDLLEDLGEAGLAGRVSYVGTVDRLEGHLAHQFGPLPDDDRDALVAKIDTTKLDRRLALEVVTYPLDPEQAALPLGTTEATMQTLVRSADGLEFSDAARRAADSMTAQFTTTINATIELNDSDGNVDVIRKNLQVLGRIAVSAEGTVEDLVVTAIEALTQDPMRRAWQNRRNLRSPVPPGLATHLTSKRLTSKTLSALRAAASIPPETFETLRAAASIPPEHFETLRAAASIPPETLETLRAASVPPETRRIINEISSAMRSPDVQQILDAAWRQGDDIR